MRSLGWVRGLASGGRLGTCPLASRRCSGRWLRCWCPRAAPRATRHPPLARAGSRGRVGDVRRAGAQPWRQRRAEVDRRDRRSVAGRRADRHAGGALWAKLMCAAALTVGTALGGWRIIRTVGRGIYRIQAVDGLASQTASAGVILGASVVGAPVSTTQVVASSVIGVGVGRGAGTTCVGRSCARWAWRGRSRFRDRRARRSRSSSGGGCRDEAAAVVPARDARRARAPARPGRGDAGGARRVRGVGAGDPAAAEGVRDAEHRGNAAKRELLTALRTAS